MIAYVLAGALVIICLLALAFALHKVFVVEDEQNAQDANKDQ
jgi:hypothetical protein